MAQQEADRIIRQFEKVQVTRRQALKWGFFAWSGISGLVAGGVDLGVTLTQVQQIRDRFEENHPIPEELTTTEAQYTQLQADIIDLASKGDTQKSMQLVDSPEYIQALKNHIRYIAQMSLRDESYDAIVTGEIEALKTLSSQSVPLWMLFMVTSVSLTLGPGGVYGPALEALENAQREARDILTTFFPNWQTEPVDFEIAATLLKTIAYLPPVGGKVYSENLTEKLTPTYAAELQSNTIIEKRRAGELESTYVHQLSVQGRLPDPFKYAALALIINAPYPHDWKEPFFAADWGKIGPLIHDGGNVDTNLNPHWHHARGRTDFLQRIYFVHDANLAQVDLHSLEALKALPVARRNDIREDRLEEARLQLENKFYQRIAFTLHCQLGTVSETIPAEIKEAAARVWGNFTLQMQELFLKYKLSDVGQAVWFVENPIVKNGWERFGLRAEADWEPIQQELIRLEAARVQNPQMIANVRVLLQETTDQVDIILGLKSIS